MNSIEKRIGDSFAKQDFMKTLGAELAVARPGFVEIHLPIRSGLLQQDGFVHAGVISSIADSAAGYAAMSLLDEGREVLTAEFKINLLAPARGEFLIARGKVLRSGKRLSVSSCDVFAISEGQEICVATLLGTISNR